MKHVYEIVEEFKGKNLSFNILGGRHGNKSGANWNIEKDPATFLYTNYNAAKYFNEDIDELKKKFPKENIKFHDLQTVFDGLFDILTHEKMQRVQFKTVLFRILGAYQVKTPQ